MFCSKCGFHLNNLYEPCKKCLNINDSFFENSFEKEEVIYGLLQNDENFELVWENSIPEESNNNYEYDEYDAYESYSEDPHDYSNNDYSAAAVEAPAVKPKRNLIVPVCIIAILTVAVLLIIIIAVNSGRSDDVTLQSETESTTEITDQPEKETEPEEVTEETSKKIYENLPEYVKILSEDEFMEYETVWLVSDFFSNKGVEYGRVGYNNKYPNEEHTDFEVYSFIMEEFIHELTGKPGDSNIERSSEYIRFADNETNEFLDAPDDMLCGINYNDESYFANATDSKQNYNLIGVENTVGNVSFASNPDEICNLSINGKNYNMKCETVNITNGYAYMCTDENTGEELYAYADLSNTSPSPASEGVDEFYFIIWDKNSDQYSLYFVANGSLYPVNIVFHKKTETVPEETTEPTEDIDQNGNGYEDNNAPDNNMNEGDNNSNAHAGESGGENNVIDNNLNDTPADPLQPDGVEDAEETDPTDSGNG